MSARLPTSTDRRLSWDHLKANPSKSQPVEAPKPQPKGFKVRLCVEAEKEPQVLGCGWRVVICQFRGKKVLLHHNSNVATMKRAAFKALVAATKAVRLKRLRPSLRLVVSNPRSDVTIAEAA